MSSDAQSFVLPPMLRAEFEAARENGRVGHVLVSETERVRVWSIRLAPGERIGFHRHVLDYFWTALTRGRARSHINGGPPRETVYSPGDTQHHHYELSQSMIHDLENIGDTELIFTTVEFIDSANKPLPVPDDARLRPKT